MSTTTRDATAASSSAPSPSTLPSTSTVPAGRTLDRVRTVRRRRRARALATIGVLSLLILAVFCLSLMVGRTVYPASDVVRVLAGQDVPGASFTVGTLRLPRAVLAALAGACFGLGGVTFQTMLRNPLASPDIIGISSGASAAAAFGIVILGLSGTAVSLLAILAGLGVAVLIYALSYRGGVAGTRLILVGIGIAAMLQSVTDWVLSKAGQWDLQEALRWLTGSLNNTSWDQALPVLGALVVLSPVLLSRAKELRVTELGDDAAQALGVRVDRTRLIVVVSAVGLIAFATAACGPIAFVALAAPQIARRLARSPGIPLVHSALTGAFLLLGADLLAQHALARPIPVGMVTVVLGGAYLAALLAAEPRSGR